MPKFEIVAPQEPPKAEDPPLKVYLKIGYNDSCFFQVEDIKGDHWTLLELTTNGDLRLPGGILAEHFPGLRFTADGKIQIRKEINF